MSSVTITYYSVRNANILGNSMRNRSTTGKFSHGRVASGTGSRGDAAIIVQIKENVNSLSFASRNAGEYSTATRDKKNSSDDFCETKTVDILPRILGLRDFSKVTRHIGNEDLGHFTRIKSFLFIQKTHFLTHVIYDV